MADKNDIPVVKPKAQKKLSRMAVEVKMDASDAINDLHGRVKPETARWHTTPQFRMHLIYTLLILIIFAGLAAIPYFIFSLLFGIAASLALFLFLACVVVALSLLIFRFHYYSGLKTKKDKAAGIHLGTAFKHYLDTREYTLSGERQDGYNKPLMVGETREFVLDYLAEPNPHAIILGGSGSGKTTTLRAFLIRSALAYGTKFLILDWNGESEEWGSKINATVWKAGKHFKINPFLLRGASVADRVSSISELFQFGAKLTPLQSNMLRTIAISYYQKNQTPSLLDIWQDVDRRSKDRKLSPEQRQYANWIDQRLRTVQRVFGTEPEEFWDGMLTRNNVVSLAGLNQIEKSTVSYSIFQRIVEYFEGQPEKMRLLVVFDDAWAVLQNQRDDIQVYEPLPSRIVRLGRKYGFGMIVSTQQLEDLPKSFTNSSAIRVVHSYKDADFLDSAKRIFGFKDLESAYLGTAGIGEAFVFDQVRAAKGQHFGDYVKIKPLDDSELGRLHETAFFPSEIKEPELPIDMGGTSVPGGISELPSSPPRDMPTPPMYLGLLAIYYNPGKPRADLVKLILGFGIVKNKATVYGVPSSPGILNNLLGLGLAVENDSKYALTDKGLKWVDADRILDTDRSRIGSTLHERMLVQTIKDLQKKYMLVVVPEPNGAGKKMVDSVDLIAYPINTKKNYLWNNLGRRGYEIQTTAIRRVILDHAERAEKNGLPLTWVSWDPGVLDAIKKIRWEKDEYMKVEI